MKYLLSILMFLATPLWAVDYYVGPSTAGAANCLTSHANDCLMATAIALVAPGDTIHLNDGTYQGANSMIWITNISGTAGNPITITADNDGNPWIDGQDAREPVLLRNSDWWILEGFDASDAGNALFTNGTVFQLTSGSDNNIIRRVCVWDSHVANNTSTLSAHYSNEGNLFEDVCVFGEGRKGYSVSQGGNFTTLRRGWIQYEKSTNTAPKLTASTTYNSYNEWVENTFFTWDQQPLANTGQCFGILAMDRLDGSDRKANVYINGSIVYSLTSHATPCYGAQTFITKMDEVHIKDFVSLVSSTHTKSAISLNQCLTAHSMGSPCSPVNMTITDASLINGTSNNISSHWTQTNVDSGANVAAIYGAESLWVNDGTKGATICYEYQDGVLTSEPLFDNDGMDNPIWPMDARINAARARAGLGAINITATLETMFGAIPDACMKSAPTPPSGNITVTNPIASSVQDDGTVTIRWTSTEVTGSAIIMCSEAGGVNPKRIATIADVSVNTYVWTPANGPCNPSQTMQVRVQTPDGVTFANGPNFTVPGTYVK